MTKSRPQRKWRSAAAKQPAQGRERGGRRETETDSGDSEAGAAAPAAPETPTTTTKKAAAESQQPRTTACTPQRPEGGGGRTAERAGERGRERRGDERTRQKHNTTKQQGRPPQPEQPRRASVSGTGGHSGVGRKRVGASTPGPTLALSARGRPRQRRAFFLAPGSVNSQCSTR